MRQLAQRLMLGAALLGQVACQDNTLGYDDAEPNEQADAGTTPNALDATVFQPPDAAEMEPSENPCAEITARIRAHLDQLEQAWAPQCVQQLWCINESGEPGSEGAQGFCGVGEGGYPDYRFACTITPLEEGNPAAATCVNGAYDHVDGVNFLHGSAVTAFFNRDDQGNPTSGVIEFERDYSGQAYDGFHNSIHLGSGGFDNGPFVGAQTREGGEIITRENTACEPEYKQIALTLTGRLIEIITDYSADCQ